MTRASAFAASALIGGLFILVTPAIMAAQSSGDFTGQPVARVASAAPGSLFGRVEDDKGAPIAGVIVSALGTSTTFAVSDRDGRFEFGTLAPGPYMLRAHLSGYAAPRAQMVQVRASARTTSSIALRRAGYTPVLAAGLAAPLPVADGSEDAASSSAAAPADNSAGSADSHTETAWRLRHARRGVLKDVAVPVDFVEGTDHAGGVTPVDLLERAVGSPARLASSFFAETPFSGQLNLLTTGSFNVPQQLFSADNAPHNVAYVRVGAPVGERGDWTVRGALTQSDISAWIVAGSYATRAPARHRYDLGMSYSTQRYDDGSPVSGDFPDGTRSAGAVYAYDSFSLSSALTLTFGTNYSRYDYLDQRGLLSPRAELTLSPAARLRITAEASRRALAPGAEEFLPPAETGIWMPAQRTFSSLDAAQRLDAERTTHFGLGVERDFGPSTLAVRAFSQQTVDQLVALFGVHMPDEPAAPAGHYIVGNAGEARATGCSAEFRTLIAGRVQGSVAYSYADAELMPTSDVRYLLLLAPSALRPVREAVHDVSTRIETNVPETSTRVLVLYRISNGFARTNGDPDGVPRPGLDARFDVQVRQSLPFMNFSSARWEMLLAVRNFFRETSSDQSIYDELLVVHPPKRLVGGVTLHF